MEEQLTLTKEEILEKTLAGHKHITAYYPYPTGNYGVDNVIASTDNYNGSKYDEKLRNIITLMVQLGAAAAGYRNDNKTAVKVQVDGLDFPVYFVKYDCKYCITKEIQCRSVEKKVFWNVE